DAAYAAATDRHVILGNTALYGATAGRLFAAGRAGDRFAVRNSGGVAVVLGEVGPNFGAGMSNGVAYVLDADAALERRTNPDMVGVFPLDAADEARVRELVREHAARTGSPRAQAILADWERHRAQFRKVAPHAAVAAPADPVAPAAERAEPAGKVA